MKTKEFIKKVVNAVLLDIEKRYLEQIVILPNIR